MPSADDKHVLLAEFRARERELIDALRALIAELENHEGQPFVVSLSQSLLELEQLIAANATRREKAQVASIIRSLNRPFVDEFYHEASVFDLWSRVSDPSWIFQEARYAQAVE
ncbi:MAG: hypothetical protein ABGZ17_05360 [Planctomycetaceae bacterium]